MLKEEKELRLLCKTVHDTKFYPIATKQITALVLAVREDCAKVGAESIKNCMRSPKIEVQEKVVNVIADYVASAIRRGGR